MRKSEGNILVVARNKKAFQSFFIIDKYEAGIELTGTEVKSIRDGKINIGDAYCKIQKDRQLFVVNMNIAVYENGGYTNHNPIRKRRLLMHRHEIFKLEGKLVQRGFTLVPLSVYFKRGYAKVELGLARGKKKEDKREDLKQKEAKKEMRHF